MRQPVLLILLVSLALLAVGCTTTPAAPEVLDETMTARIHISPVPTSTATPAKTGPAVTETATQPAASPTPTSTQTPAFTIKEDQIRGMVIQVWHPWNGILGDAFQQLVDKFNTSNPFGIIVQSASHGNYDDLYTSVRNALEKGTAPDVTAAYLYEALAWGENIPLVDLSPMITDPVWGIPPETQAEFYPVFWNQISPTGERLAVPALGYGQVLYYNQSWAHELGFDSPPLTPEQFEQQVCAAAKANNQDQNTENDNTGGLILSTHYSPVLGWLQAFNAKTYDPVQSSSSKSPYQFNTPEVAETFTFLRDLYDQGCAWLVENPYPEAEFANRRALIAPASVQNIPEITRLMAQTGNMDHWQVIPYPSTGNEAEMNAYGPTYQIFSSNPQREQAAWVFLHWLLLPENQAHMAVAANALPTSQSALPFMDEYQSNNPQWVSVLNLVPSAINEPNSPSWKIVRWALSDAATQLFRSYFTIDQVPELVEFLDKTADDLYLGSP